MPFTPTGNSLVTSVALPLTTIALPMTVSPLKKVTIPPGFVPSIVAVSVTAEPNGLSPALTPSETPPTVAGFTSNSMLAPLPN
ncbi:hypothetical protein D3C85_1590630 [compost metagenome]